MIGTTASASAIDNERIDSIDGDITYLVESPVSLELGDLESDSELFLFTERQDYVLTTDLAIDLSQPGDYFPDTVPEEQVTWEALNPDVIPAGTRVDSYYFHFDNETYDDTFNLQDYVNCVGQYPVSGTITFENPVLGIVMRAGAGENATLRFSDLELGLPGVNYDQRYLRHFPGVNIADGCGSDRFILSEDRRTLSLTNFTDIHHDNCRVIVAADAPVEATSTLDVDGNDTVTAVEDGLNVLRVLLDAPEESIVLGAGATRDREQVAAAVTAAELADIIDVDLSGGTNALEDGLNILRVMLGAPEESIVLGAGATRDRQQVVAAIDDLL